MKALKSQVFKVYFTLTTHLPLGWRCVGGPTAAHAGADWVHGKHPARDSSSAFMSPVIFPT